jgi:ABC-type amino acid transport substrate-binding protein
VFGERTTVALAAFAATAALAFAGCGGDDNDSGSGSGSSSGAAKSDAPANGFKPLNAGQLTVGMNLQFKPEMYLDNGKPAGYDVDLLNELAPALNAKLNIQNLDFNGLIPGLQSKKFDMVSVGLTPTEERKQVVDFTRAYVPYALVLGVPSKDAASTTSVDALNAKGKTITALQGSSGEQLAKKLFPDAKVQGFPDQNAAFLEVATSRADAIVVENYLLAQFNKSNPGKLKEAPFAKPLHVEYGSWAVQKGNNALVKRLNAFICKTQKSGKLAAYYKAAHGAKLPPMPAC